MNEHIKKWCVWLGGVGVTTVLGATLIVFAGVIFVNVHDTSAIPCQLSDGTTGECLESPLLITKPTEIPKLIGMILRMVFAVIGVVALIIFIYGGVLWMTAFGEEQRVKKGWDTMIWAALGLIVIFGSYIAVDFILRAILGG